MARAIGNPVQPRSLPQWMLLLFYSIFTFFAADRSEAATLKSRLQTVGSVLVITDEIVVENTQSSSLLSERSTWDLLRTWVREEVFTVEISVRSKILYSTACQWERLRAFCWDIFSPLIPELRLRKETALAADLKLEDFRQSLVTVAHPKGLTLNQSQAHRS